jgi:hypothetical protein
MGYAAIALAIIGLLTGMMFRIRVLLSLVALLLLVSVAVGIGRGFGFLTTTLTVLAAQTIFQTSYFLGLVAVAIFHRLLARVATEPTERDQASAVEQSLMAFGTPNRTPRSQRLFARGIAQDQSPCRQP